MGKAALRTVKSSCQDAESGSNQHLASTSTYRNTRGRGTSEMVPEEGNETNQRIGCSEQLVVRLQAQCQEPKALEGRGKCYRSEKIQELEQ